MTSKHENCAVRVLQRISQFHDQDMYRYVFRWKTSAMFDLFLRNSFCFFVLNFDDPESSGHYRYTMGPVARNKRLLPGNTLGSSPGDYGRGTLMIGVGAKCSSVFTMPRGRTSVICRI